MTDGTTRYPVNLEVEVAWGDMDALGHVNNIIYFQYFESARIAYMRQLGVPVTLDHDLGGPILARATCDFRRPLAYPDRVRVEAGVTRLGKSSLTMVYRIFSQAQQAEVAGGESVLVWFDYPSQKSVPIPGVLRDKIEALEMG